MKLVTRRQWGARSARGQAGYLASTRGVKVHYTGSYVDPRLADDHGRCAAMVRQIQNGHMDGNGWNDIGYSLIVCPHRYVYEGRGLHALPAANGPNLNSGHYAILGLVGNKGLTQPSDDMLHGIRDAIEYARREGGAGGEIKGHRDGYSTDCPGAKLYAWVKQGAPRPNTTTEEDDMALSDSDWKKLEALVYKAVWRTDQMPAPDSNPDNPTWMAESVLTDVNKKARAILAALTALPGADVDETAIVKGVLEGLTPATIAAALADALPADLARQVLDELAGRLGAEQTSNS